MVRHARLVDYEPRPATSARTQLVCEVSGTALPAGIEVQASDPAGELVPFEIGTGLADATTYRVDLAGTRSIPIGGTIPSAACSRGATGMWLKGTGFGFYDGQPLLIDTKAASPARSPAAPDRACRVVVNVTPVETTDLLFGTVDRRDPDFLQAGRGPAARSRSHAGPRSEQTSYRRGRRRGRELRSIGRRRAAPQMPRAFTRLGANATVDDPTRLPLFARRGDALVAFGR